MVIIFFAGVDGKLQACTDSLIESRYVVVDVGLADIALSVQDVVEVGTGVDFVEAFVGVVYFRIIHGLDGFGCA